jgi:hypothetical protein
MVRPTASKGEAGDAGRLVTVPARGLIVHRRAREPLQPAAALGQRVMKLALSTPERSPLSRRRTASRLSSSVQMEGDIERRCQ